MTHMTTMAEVRAEIDRLDRELVTLMGKRLACIAAAARIKPSRHHVRDEARIADVVAKVRAAAPDAGLEPDIAEAIWRTMMGRFIAHEFKLFDDMRGGGA